MTGKLYWPFDPSLVTEWPGDRGGGNWHYGTDFGVPYGTPLVACFDGVVEYAQGDGARGELYPGSGIWANGEGLTVDIVRADGLRARYGHMSRIDVQVGQRVSAGQTLGAAGDTGYSIGVHCHWELRWDNLWAGGMWVDPRDLEIHNLSELTRASLPTTRKQEKKLLMAYFADAGGKGQGRWAVFGPNFWLELKTQGAANAFSAQLGVKAYVTDAGGWAKFKEVSGG